MSADFPGESSGKSPVSFHAATALGKIFPCLASIASEKRGSPMTMIPSSINLLLLTSRTYSGGINKALATATKDHQRRFEQLYVIIVIALPYTSTTYHRC